MLQVAIGNITTTYLHDLDLTTFRGEEKLEDHDENSIDLRIHNLASHSEWCE